MKFEGGWPVRDMLAQYLRNSSQRAKRELWKIVPVHRKGKRKADKISDSDDTDLDDSKPKSDSDASGSTSSDEGDNENDGSDSSSDSDSETTGSDKNLDGGKSDNTDSESDSEEDHIKKNSTVGGDWVLARSRDNKMTVRHSSSKNRLPQSNEKVPKSKRQFVDLEDDEAEVDSSLFGANGLT
ncbi:hypothetical protein J3R82DRAFT_10047 [Butyriboletus roseoflavus]|nr:hypothetical protein J3R82DRAFT_10047 [Butyriboletus roseoflavus]